LNDQHQPGKPSRKPGTPNHENPWLSPLSRPESPPDGGYVHKKCTGF